MPLPTCRRKRHPGGIVAGKDAGAAGVGRNSSATPSGGVDELSLGREPRVPKLPADLLRVVEHDRGRLQPLQRAAGQAAEPPRPRLRRRVEQAAEGVEVVAEHADAAGRERARGHRITVVRDVEPIEPRANGLEVPRQIDVPVEQPVGVERGPLAADDRQPPGPAAERRRQVRRRDSRHGGQVREQLVGAQVHAGPALGPVVPHHAEPEGGKKGTALHRSEA